MAMVYRVNAGHVPPDSWVQDPAAGGRIVGEGCHFIDFLAWLNGSLPVSVHAAAIQPSCGVPDTVTITLAFRNGSIGTVAYFANGDRSLPKERVEVFADGTAAVIDDFRSLTVHANGRRTEKRLYAQDKGQKEEVRRFIDAVRRGDGEPIPFAETYSATLAAFMALDSLRTGNSVRIHP
jgi:polar amino acid transport system substrate-binding protein